MNKSTKWNLNWTRISMVKDFNFLEFSSSNQMNQLQAPKLGKTNEKKPYFGNPQKGQKRKLNCTNLKQKHTKCCTRGRKLYNNFTNCPQPRRQKTPFLSSHKSSLKKNLRDLKLTDDPWWSFRAHFLQHLVGKDVIFISQMQISDSVKKYRLPLKLGREEVRVRGLEVGEVLDQGERCNGRLGSRKGKEDIWNSIW